MMSKATLVLCAQALFVQVVFSQCLGRLGPSLAAPSITAAGLGCGASALSVPAIATSAISAPALAASGYGYGYTVPAIEAVPISGGGLSVTSVSPIAPTGLAVSSANAIEGNLLLTGELPFLSAVGLNGAYPSAGAGAVSYSCGNGVTAITSEGLGLGASYGPALGAIAPGAALGLGNAAIAPSGLLASGISSILPDAGVLGCGFGNFGSLY